MQDKLIKEWTREVNRRFHLAGDAMKRQAAKEKKPRSKSDARPPTYQELADLVCELVETNIANLDGVKHRFVSCFTYSSGDAPDHWHRAIAARENLIASKIIERQIRKADPKKIRSMR